MEKRIGRQEPTTHFALPYKQTDGEDAVRLYELTGRIVFEWQKVITYDLLARNADGLWSHTKYGYEVPRQNGKGEILIMRELVERCTIFGGSIRYDGSYVTTG